MEDNAKTLKEINQKLDWIMEHLYQRHPFKRFIRLAEVQNRVGYGRSSIYKLINEGNFPKPYHHLGNASLWLESEITEWMDNIIKSE